MTTRAAGVPAFFSVEALQARWGVSRETIMEHVNAGRLQFVDLSPVGVKRKGKGPRLIGFTEAHVLGFEAERSRVFADAAPAEPTPPPVAGVWSGRSRLGGGRRPRRPSA